MNSIRRLPVTAAAVAAMTLFLSGCIAYDAASTVVDAGSTVISTAGDIVTAPFGGDDSDNAKKH